MFFVNVKKKHKPSFVGRIKSYGMDKLSAIYCYHVTKEAECAAKNDVRSALYCLSVGVGYKALRHIVSKSG